MPMLIATCEYVVQNDIGSLVAQLNDLQKRNAEFEDENKRLSSKVLI